MRFILAQIGVFACLWLGWHVYQDSEEIANAERGEKRDERSPMSVEVTPVISRSMEDRIDLVGTLAPASEINIRARTTGYITSLPFEVGDYVEQSQVVVELDESQQQELVTGTQAELKVARAQLAAAEARLSLAHKVADRQKQLAESGVATEEQQEKARAELDIAKSETELERARVEQQQSTLDRAELALEQLKITSSLAGFVAERFVDVGDLADPNTPLLRLVNLSTVHTVVHVVEKDYARVQPQQRATVRVEAYPDHTFDGVVIRVAPILDRETRSAAVEIEVDNPRALIKPGMFARVTVIFERNREAKSVPVAAVMENDRRSTVFVVDGDPPIATMRDIETGINDGRFVEIRSGVESDDKVITLGNRMIKTGDVVKPVPAKLAEARTEHGIGAE